MQAYLDQLGEKCTRNEHCGNQPVHRNDTSHNDWDEGFDNQLWIECARTSDSNSGLGRSVRRPDRGENHCGCHSAKSKKGAVSGTEIDCFRHIDKVS
ncbi:hypothetical protein AX774_g5381 [Zancudomyces culisetae]|uniref:Uncharacterized protein n=1 Tax=Zancudomyces culisetae TaxID=1213189 RepID=A0A1R1PJM4_ZANCU|nr:hypothetical protein AX774_g5381 [Zancudomyces culisetae]|eukprot:OMH81170.1 hypothetical protein AX774_g5381 [Zancudomyces culisetae]